MSAPSTTSTAPVAAKSGGRIRKLKRVAWLALILGALWFIDWETGWVTQLWPMKDARATEKKKFKRAINQYISGELAGEADKVAEGEDKGIQKLHTVIAKADDMERSLEGTTATAQTKTVSLAAYETANLEDFHVDCNAPNVCEVQNDARRIFPPTGILLEPGDRAVIDADPGSKVCASPVDPCSGPNGIMGLTKLSTVSPQDFPTGDAMLYALIGKCGDGPVFQIGTRKEFTTTQACELRADDNSRVPYKDRHSGGHKWRVVIHRHQSGS